MFRLKGEHIVNEKGQVLDVQKGEDSEGSSLVVANASEAISQRFELLYVDNDKPEPKKGEFNKDFGLYVDRPFQVVSKMGDGRYLDIIGSSVALKTRNGGSSQSWYFDQQSKTIKSVKNQMSWSFSSNNLSVMRTTGQWFQFFKFEMVHWVNTASGKVIDCVKDVEGQTVAVRTKNDAAES